jgi:hypothetical protein
VFAADGDQKIVAQDLFLHRFVEAACAVPLRLQGGLDILARDGQASVLAGMVVGLLHQVRETARAG